MGNATLLTMVNLLLGAVKCIGAGDNWQQHGANDDGHCGVEVWPSTRDSHNYAHTCPFNVHITDSTFIAMFATNLECIILPSDVHKSTLALLMYIKNVIHTHTHTHTHTHIYTCIYI